MPHPYNPGHTAECSKCLPPNAIDVLATGQDFTVTRPQLTAALTAYEERYGPLTDNICPTCRGTGGGTYNDCPACDGNGVR